MSIHWPALMLLRSATTTKTTMVVIVVIILVGLSYLVSASVASRACTNAIKEKEDEIINLKLEIVKKELSVEKTPQQELAEKLSKQEEYHTTMMKKNREEYLKQINNLNNTINQMKADGLRPSLAGLQQELKEKDQLRQDLIRLTNDVNARFAKIQRELDDKKDK